MTQEIKTGWRRLLFGDKKQDVCTQDTCVNIDGSKTTLRKSILEVLEENDLRFMAIHEIGNAIRARGIFYNDPSVSSCLRANANRGGVRDKVVGQRRGISRMKEWKLA